MPKTRRSSSRLSKALHRQKGPPRLRQATPRRWLCSPRRTTSPRGACDCVKAYVYGMFGVNLMARFIIVYG